MGEVGEVRGFFVVFPDNYMKYVGGNDFQDPDEVFKEFYEPISDTEGMWGVNLKGIMDQGNA